MAAVTCPQGHQSNDPEWCDVCGERIGATPVIAPPPAAPEPVATSAAAVPCPHCGAANVGDALFCEECGYDFTTGQAPPEPAAAPVAPAAAGEPAPAATPWVVVVEIDPQWYALKGSLADTPCPPANTYTVPLTAATSLIGRTSSTRGVRPDIALDRDTGVSRRHAQLVHDGEQLTVVDLSSTNGTYVVAAGAEPGEDTEPLAADDVHPLHDGDRVYLGAWTRLTVRRA